MPEHFEAIGQPQRRKAIARNIAPHGVTLGALAFTGVRGRGFFWAVELVRDGANHTFDRAARYSTRSSTGSATC